MKTKKALRKELKLKAGRIQISYHGCGKYSIQVISKAKGLVQDINIAKKRLFTEQIDDAIINA